MRRRAAAAVVILLACLVSISSAQSCVRNPYPFRLPTTVTPNSYSLHLANFDLEARTYDGQVNISSTISTPTTCIILHSRVRINNFVVTNMQTGAFFAPASLNYEDDKQWVVANFPSAFSVGAYDIKVDFSGQILPPSNTTIPAKGFVQSHTDLPIPKMKADAQPFNMRQFAADLSFLRIHDPDASDAEIMARYLEENTETVTISGGHGRLYATNFEPNHAREAFPLFDEPVFKATWKLAIDIPAGENLTALFNTDLESVAFNQDTNTETWTFKRTPVVMSPYLVCWAFGWLDYVETNSNNVRYRIYAPVGGSKYAQTALQISVNVINSYGKFWKIPYAFDKLDQLVLPSQLTSAMENWGLVTYGPTLLLLDALPTELAKAVGGSVIAHELAHQWFGNLITCQWWNSTYINEGFANWLQNAGLRAAAPKLQEKLDATMSGFFGGSYVTGLNSDLTGANGPIIKRSTTSSNPEGNWDTPLSNVYTFDRITYGKGAAINKMMQLYLGSEDKWNAALAYYLQKYSYRNPSADDLLESLAVFGGASLPSKFGPWLYQAGFPVLSARYNSTARQLTVTQSPSTTTLIDPATRWPMSLAISVLNANGTLIKNYPLELTGTSSAITFPYWEVPDDAVVLVNMNHSTFAVVNYAQDFPAVFSVLLSDTQPLTRALHLTDLNIAIVTKRVPIDLLFTIVEIMTNRLDDSQAWAVLLNHLLTTYIPTNLTPEFLDELSGSLSEARSRVGMVPDGVHDTIRSNLMLASAWADSEDLTDFCVRVVFNHTTMGTPIDTAIRLPCYVSAVRASEEMYELLLNTVVANSSQFEPADLAAMKSALMAVPDSSRCDQVISVVVPDPSAGLVGLTDMIKFNYACRPAAWKFYQVNARAYLLANGWNWKNFLVPLYLFNTKAYYSQVELLLSANADLLPWQARQDTLATIATRMQ